MFCYSLDKKGNKRTVPLSPYASLKGYDADYILEEILCDYEAGMNVFSKEKVPDSFFEMSQKILQSDAVKQDSVRGPPVDGEGHFSRETERFLRNFTGEGRSDGYLYLSKVEVATIRSNIKSRATYLSKTAVDGLVWAHSLNSGYAYTFRCNPDYSVTVTDVLDAESDITIINRTTERMKNYARTGPSIRRNSDLNGQPGNGKNGGNTGGGSHAQTGQGQGANGVVSQPSPSNGQGSVGPGHSNRTNSGTDTARSAAKIKFSRETSYAQQVDEVKNNTHDPNNHVYMGTTPMGIVKVLDLPKLPMLVTSQHIYSMAVSEQQARAEGRYRSHTNYHKLGWDAVKNLAEYINKPVLIVKSTTDKNDARFIVVTAQMDNDGNPIVAAVKPNGTGNYFGVEIPTNFMLSGYGKNSFQNFVAKAKTENRILYANKNSQKNKNTPSVQYADNILSSDYTTSLAEFKKIVKEKFEGTIFANSGLPKHKIKFSHEVSFNVHMEGGNTNDTRRVQSGAEKTKNGISGNDRQRVDGQKNRGNGTGVPGNQGKVWGELSKNIQRRIVSSVGATISRDKGTVLWGQGGGSLVPLVEFSVGKQ